jgi:hypothetical protein
MGLWASRHLVRFSGLKWCPENIRKPAKATSPVSGGNKNERNSPSRHSGNRYPPSSLPVVLAMH